MIKTYEKRFDETTVEFRGNYRYRLFAERVRSAATKIGGKDMRIYPIYDEAKQYIVGIEVTVFGKTAAHKRCDTIIREALLLKEAA